MAERTLAGGSPKIPPSAGASGVSEIHKTPEDFEHIRNMLTLADKYDLTTEVIYSFAESLMTGDTVPEAARCALYEWDLIA